MTYAAIAFSWLRTCDNLQTASVQMRSLPYPRSQTALHWQCRTFITTRKIAIGCKVSDLRSFQLWFFLNFIFIIFLVKLESFGFALAIRKTTGATCWWERPKSSPGTAIKVESHESCWEVDPSIGHCRSINSLIIFGSLCPLEVGSGRKREVGWG